MDFALVNGRIPRVQDGDRPTSMYGTDGSLQLLS